MLTCGSLQTISGKPCRRLRPANKSFCHIHESIEQGLLLSRSTGPGASPDDILELSNRVARFDPFLQTNLPGSGDAKGRQISADAEYARALSDSGDAKGRQISADAEYARALSDSGDAKGRQISADAEYARALSDSGDAKGRQISADAEYARALFNGQVPDTFDSADSPRAGLRKLTVVLRTDKKIRRKFMEFIVDKIVIGWATSHQCGHGRYPHGVHNIDVPIHQCFVLSLFMSNIAFFMRHNIYHPAQLREVIHEIDSTQIERRLSIGNFETPDIAKVCYYFNVIIPILLYGENEDGLIRTSTMNIGEGGEYTPQVFCPWRRYRVITPGPAAMLHKLHLYENHYQVPGIDSTVRISDSDLALPSLSVRNERNPKTKNN